MDLDGDGYLSMYELEYFYEEQLQRMESLGIETLPFEDCLCQVCVFEPKSLNHFQLSINCFSFIS
jgi:serine/threonine-protein phosphatase 2A regulatory subunit B''